MSKHLTQEKKKELAEEYLICQNLSKMALKHSLNSDTIRQAVIEMGIPIKPYKGRIENPHEKLLTDHPEYAQMIEYVHQTHNLKEAQKIFGLTHQQMKDIRKKLDIPWNETGQYKKIFFDEQKAVDLYNTGKTYKEIAQLFGIASDEVVRRRLAKLNVQSRVGKAIGNNNPQWKGGKTQTMHYYRRLAYEVAAVCLKRPLKKGEVIHHLDENAKNNHPNNLVHFPSGGSHQKWHQTTLSLRKKGIEVDSIQTALELGGSMLPIPENLDQWIDDIGLPSPSDNSQ